MRGLQNRDGKAFFNPWTENAAASANAVSHFDIKPAASAVQGPVGPQALIDNIPGNTSTTAVLTVGAPALVSAIDTIADEDFYKITLVAGHEYQIGLYGYTPAAPTDPIGPNGAPLLDSFLELYNSAGQLITSADGGSDTTLNTANSGFDALLSYTATTSGTYYVNARGFDQTPLDGSTRGDMIGDYGLYAKDVTDDPSNYHAYYSPDSPLYAIDWGVRVNKHDQTAANPDGDEGIRPTGNAQGTPHFEDPTLISTLAAQQGVNTAGKNVITVYFAKAGDIFTSIEDPTSPGLPPATITATGVQAFEHNAVMTALGEFSKVADIVYLEVQDRSKADFTYTSYIGTPGPGVSLLGSMSPPDEPDEGLAQFNSGDERWNALNLQQGGFSFVTLIHEFGHGHGLAHPHDNGGHSGIMHGVEPEGAGVADYTTGDFALNQSVFTMMSYEDGWQSSPYGNADTDVGYGYLGGLMAFDIAAIQDKYGVNENWASGDNVYEMKDVNAAGTYYSSIWDTGGFDRIVYSGARNASIDLRPATLQYEVGGGGNVSYATGIYGGYTIANAVTIEMAVSGSGNDTLIGNAAANFLVGGAGNDIMTGLAGNDNYYIDTSADQVIEAVGGGSDRIAAMTSYTLAAGSEVELVEAINLNGTEAMNLIGNEFNNRLVGNAGDNYLIGGGGNDFLVGSGGNDNFYADMGDTIEEYAGGGSDRVAALGSFVLAGSADVQQVEAVNLTATDAFNLTGNGIAQRVVGNYGNNVIDGGGGNDLLLGLNGSDTFAFSTALGANNVDTVEDFVHGTDKVALDDAIFTALGGLGSLNANAFVTGTAAGDADDRIIYNSTTGQLFYDADGNGGGGAVLFAQLYGAPTLSASDFQVI